MKVKWTFFGLVVGIGYLGFPGLIEAQERKIIPLDTHYLPIESGDEGQKYSKIVTVSPKGNWWKKPMTLITLSAGVGFTFPNLRNTSLLEQAQI